MNKLKNENSPYLLQHADNPVEWYPWGEEALEKARIEDKPIFLSIGYAACHWCHVMEHESFEDEAVAAIMNEKFINIKVDREERPDIDNIYMNAVVAMTGQGGWPLSVFLTPEGKPFYGGTYFPPQRRYNMPSFQEVLLSISRVWKEDQQKIAESSDKITEHLKNSVIVSSEGEKIDKNTHQQASLALAQSYDWEHGGWGQAPKFPQPMAIEFLLRRVSHGDKFALEICTHALDAMAKGGMYDVVGGGFARYSTDSNWLVPHFEKMLYDNAQLSQVYLYAYLLTGNRKYKDICNQTLTFILREMRDPAGGFYSSLDADSEGEEGIFYIWTPEQINQALGNDADINFIREAYEIHESGNFEGKTVLQRKLSDKELGEKFNISEEEAVKWLDKIHRKLLSARSQRIKPNTDDKVLTAWNGLMMISFAEAGRYLNRDDYIDIAKQNAEFILENLSRDGLLLRSWRNGKSAHPGYLEDYAALILGLLALYQSDPDPHWYDTANSLLDELRKHFRHPDVGFYDTRDDQENLLLRPRDLQDNAIPSGNAMAAHALLIIAAYSGKDELRSEAEAMIASMHRSIARYPLGFAKWLSALDFASHPVREVAILGNPAKPETIALNNVLWNKFRPYLVAAQDSYPADPKSPPLLNDRILKNGKPTAYVCQNFVCHQPVNQPEHLEAQLNNPIYVD